MSYYLEKNELFSEGIKRIALEQNSMAINALASDDEVHSGVHKARKHFKKIRALYRLVRDEVGKKSYKEGNLFYRGLGRKLENLRDITSRIETIELLRENYGGTIRGEAFQIVQAMLEEERQAVWEREALEGDQVEETIQQLQEARERLLGLPVRNQCLDEVAESLQRVYGRGYRAYRKATKAEAPSLELMHEWRKRVKYLWYHHRLLRQAWPVVFKGYRRSAKHLASLLGDYHDLGLIQLKLDAYGENLDEEVRRTLCAVSREHQLKLLDASRREGKLWYAEQPQAYRQRMRRIIKDNLI